MQDRQKKHPSQNRTGRERGAVRKPAGGRIPVCLIYPNTYFVGMSNLGFQGIYGMLNRREDTLCERAFLPGDKAGRDKRPALSEESGKRLSDFEIVAFSVSFENDYPNIIELLRRAGIPPLAADRSARDPLIVMGGVCAISNPEPLAPFFDLIFIGEAEGGLLDEFMDLMGRGLRREELLEAAAGIEGVYVPSFYDVLYDDSDHSITRRPLTGNAPEVIKRRRLEGLEAGVRHSISTPDTEFSEMQLIEAMRGCPWSCRFCLAGHIYKPVRSKTFDAIREEIESWRHGEGRRVGLIGPSLTDHPRIGEVLGMEGVEFSITSLRAGRKSARVVEAMRGKKSVSIAPEAGTGRLREIINKKVTEEDILEAAGMLFELGVERLRLYFMAGLPWETDDDLRGIVELTERIRALSPVRGEINITLSTFVPKPWTPFQWEPMPGLKEARRRLDLVKKGLKGLRGVGVFHDVPKYARLQGLLAMGDRRVAGSLNVLNEPGRWEKTAEEAGLDVERYIGRRKGFEEDLPWDFIDHGIDKAALVRENEDARKKAGGQ